MKIKFGQIGVGHAHAEGKLSAFRASEEFEVVGVVEPDAALRERARANPAYDGLRWMTREELLDSPGLRVVLVETAVRDLLENAEACVAAGMHIHLDKPAGASLSRFQRVLDLAARRHLTVQMGYMYRYSPAVVFLRDCLARGWLGEPFEAHAVMSKVVPSADRQKLAEYPGGTMFELGCHLIDLVVQALGAPDQVRPFSRRVVAEDGLNDNMLAVLEYAKALATVKSTAVEVEGFARRHFVVCGTEGTLHIEPLDRPSVRLALSRPRGDYPRGVREVRFPAFQRYVGDASDLARIVRGEKAPDFSYEHDRIVQETVLRASGMPLG